jgi:hypothetical protein
MPPLALALSRANGLALPRAVFKELAPGMTFRLNAADAPWRRQGREIFRDDF